MQLELKSCPFFHTDKLSCLENAAITSNFYLNKNQFDQTQALYNIAWGPMNIEI